MGKKGKTASHLEEKRERKIPSWVPYRNLYRKGEEEGSTRKAENGKGLRGRNASTKSRFRRDTMINLRKKKGEERSNSKEASRKCNARDDELIKT